MTPINPPTNRRNTRHKHDAPPPAPEHVRHAELGQQKRRLQVDPERVRELVERDVEDVGDAAAVPGVGDEHVRPALPVLGREVHEQLLQVRRRARAPHVRHVHRDLARRVLRRQLPREHVRRRPVLVARQRQRGALLPEVTGTGSADADVTSQHCT